MTCAKVTAGTDAEDVDLKAAVAARESHFCVSAGIT